MTIQPGCKCAVVMVAVLFAAGLASAQRDFGRVVGGINDPRNLAAIIAYLDSVAAGQVAAAPYDRSQAEFWRAEARYRKIVERGECSGEERLYSDTGSSVYQMLSQVYDADLRAAAIEKQAWCLWRASECCSADSSGPILTTLLRYLANDTASLISGSPSHMHLQRMRAVAAYRMLIIASRQKLLGTDIRDLEATAADLGDGEPLAAALHRAAVLAATARAYSAAGEYDKASEKLAQANHAARALGVDYPSLKASATGADVLRQLEKLGELMNLALGRAADANTLRLFEGGGLGPLGMDEFARIWAYCFAHRYADPYLAQNGISRASIWAPGSYSARDGFNHDITFWVGWAKYIESFKQKSGPFNGAAEFRSFIAGRAANDAMAIEAYYRLADIEYRNGQVASAIQSLQRIVDIDSPRREDARFKLDVYRLEAAIGTGGDIDHRIGNVLYRLQQRQDLSNRDRVRLILQLGRHFMARAAAPNNSRMVTLSLYDLCESLLATLEPGYSNAYLRSFTTDDGFYVGNVLISIQGNNRQLREARLLRVIGKLRAAPYRGIQDSRAIINDISGLLRMLDDSGSEGDYIRARALYTAGMFEHNELLKRASFDSALTIFNRLLGEDAQVGVRALYYMGLVFKDIATTVPDLSSECSSYSQRCHARIFRLRNVGPTDRWYRLAMEQLGGVLTTEQTAFQYQMGNGQRMSIDLGQLQEYAEPGAEQITFEMVESDRQYELDGILQEYADVWIRFAGTVPQIPLSIHRMRSVAEGIFPVVSDRSDDFAGLVNEYWGLVSKITFDLGVFGRDWVQSNGPVVHIGGEARLEGQSASIDTSVTLKLDSRMGHWRGTLTLEPPIGSEMDSLLFCLDGFYVFRYDGSSRVQASIEHVFSREVGAYAVRSVAGEGPYRIVIVPGNGLVCRREIAENIEDILKKANSLHYRDFTPLASGGAGLVGVQSMPPQIMSVDADGHVDGYLSPDREVGEMAWPEGIASDSAGNLYVADWGNHRVLIYDKAKGAWRAIGAEGINESPNSGRPVVFTFPTRIAVEEPPAGSGKPTYLLIADMNGVHRVDVAGFYVDTLVGAGSDNWTQGEFYGLACEGYGQASRLYLADRKSGRLLQYTPPQ